MTFPNLQLAKKCINITIRGGSAPGAVNRFAASSSSANFRDCFDDIADKVLYVPLRQRFQVQADTVFLNDGLNCP